jgi:hypothetical protein
MRYSGRTTLAALLVTGATVACSDSGPALAPSQARISIDAGIVQQLTAGFSASVAGTAVAISPDTVQSLTIQFTDVAFLPVGASENDAASWQTLTLAAPVTLDLMALPTTTDGSVEIAAGSVPVGQYQMVRLMVGEGEIVFKGPISLGGAASFDGGTPYAVTIPSGSQTGIKTDVSFEVTEGQDATANAAYLVFTPGTTFQNVTVTGNGGVMLAPVIHGQ